MHWIYLIHEFHNFSWITEINVLFHDVVIYWNAPVYVENAATLTEIDVGEEKAEHKSASEAEWTVYCTQYRL